MAALRSIRFQLLAAVNLAIAPMLLLFLFLDYRREIEKRVEDKHTSLEEEAKTLLPAVVRLRPQGRKSMQEYLDSVCGRMQEAPSPGHHIAASIAGDTLQAVVHHRSSPEMFAAMLAAARSDSHQAPMGKDTLLVGHHQEGDISVFVSEYLASVWEAAERQALYRLLRFVPLALAATVAVNLAFLRLVARPVETLVQTVRQIAQGKLGAQAGPFQTDEMDYLADAVNAMSASLAEVDRGHRLQMAKARRIQEHLLPQESQVPGLKLARFYQPADEVAGDYYDVLPLADGTWLFCIADVVGHGVPAAMSAVLLKALLLHAAERSPELSDIFAFVNRRFATHCLAGDFASMLLARWNPSRGTLEYGSAGHETAWLLPASGPLCKIASTGALLAIDEDLAWETRTLRVTPGDRLLLVTDGVTEAQNPSGELFHRSRLAKALDQCRSSTLEAMVDQIEAALRTHCSGRAFADDVTLVALEFGGIAPSASVGVAVPHLRPIGVAR